jgi:hypothetical protein
MIYENYEELIKHHPIPIYSDLREFIKLYARFGVECKIIVDDVYIADYCAMKAITGKCFKIRLSDVGVANRNKATISEKFTGYNRFYSEIVFNEKGEFVSQGYWE